MIRYLTYWEHILKTIRGYKHVYLFALNLSSRLIPLTSSFWPWNVKCCIFCIHFEFKIHCCYKDWSKHFPWKPGSNSKQRVYWNLSSRCICSNRSAIRFQTPAVKSMKTCVMNSFSNRKHLSLNSLNIFWGSVRIFYSFDINTLSS